MTRTLAPIDKPTNESAPMTSLSTLPAGKLWHRCLPESVAKALKKDPAAGWEAFSAFVQKKKTTLATDELALGLPLSATLASAGTSLFDWLKQTERLTSKSNTSAVGEAIAHWQFEVSDRVASPALGIQALCWTRLLPVLAATIDSDTWWSLVETLMGLASEAGQHSPGEKASAEQVLTHQLLGGELPLTLAALFPEIKPLRQLHGSAAEALSEGMLAQTDGEGLPSARSLAEFPQLLACWTRCRSLTCVDDKRCWSKSAETQYEWLVRQTLRLANSDGTLALVPPVKNMSQLIHQALALGGDSADQAAAALRLKKASGKAAPKRSRAKTASPEEAPEPSVNSEWSGLSVLTGSWKPKAPRLTVMYDGSRMRLELTSGGKQIFAGDWLTDIVINGSAHSPRGDWEEQLWFSDADCDYLELTQELEGGARHERQIMLAKQDDAIYFSDIVLGQDTAETLEVDTRMPLAPAVSFAGAEETREGWLKRGDKQVAGVLPLGLAEWRIDPRIGELTQEGLALTLKQRQPGPNMCCPLWLDLKPTRFAKQRTWRRLTVAQSLEPVPASTAVGYRAQSGKDQWLVYRSLNAPENRSVLGQNYACEGVIGRFNKEGDVSEYIETNNE